MMTVQFAAIAVALLACVFDLRTRRIPNVLTFGAALAGLAFHLATGGLPGAGSSFAGWLLGMALFFPLFALRGLGAGDVKLLGAFGAWLGPTAIVGVGLLSAVAGGALAIGVAIASGYARQACSNIWTLLCFWRVMGLRPMPALTLEHAAAPRLAYAIPMLTGLMVNVWLR